MRVHQSIEHKYSLKSDLVPYNVDVGTAYGSVLDIYFNL
jgi:hypothetical protein